jgi:Domain of unknown function (DUF4118)
VGRIRRYNRIVDEKARVAFGSGIGALGAIAAAAALVPVREQLGSANAALVLVLSVLVGAVIGGRRAGFLVAVVAAMSFDFLHTRPYGSLKIADGKDIVTLVLLVAVGMIIGEIALRADRIREAGTRRWIGVRRIHRVAQLAADGQAADDVILAVTAELTDTLHLQNCWFERAPYRGTFDAIEVTGSLATKEYRYTRDGFELSREGVEIPVRSGDHSIGRFVLIPTPGVGISRDDRLIALALADQVGIVLGRVA